MPVYTFTISHSHCNKLCDEEDRESQDFGISWDHRRLADLDFADDLALLNHTRGTLSDMTNKLHGCREKVEL